MRWSGHPVIVAPPRHERMEAFPRKRLVKTSTKRFRGNATDVTGEATAIRPDALSAVRRVRSGISVSLQRSPGGEPYLLVFFPGQILMGEVRIPLRDLLVSQRTVFRGIFLYMPGLKFPHPLLQGGRGARAQVRADQLDLPRHPPVVPDLEVERHIFFVPVRPDPPCHDIIVAPHFPSAHPIRVK